jgi:hypothetical protein
VLPATLLLAAAGRYYVRACACVNARLSCRNAGYRLAVMRQQAAAGAERSAAHHPPSPR